RCFVASAVPGQNFPLLACVARGAGHVTAGGSFMISPETNPLVRHAVRLSMMAGAGAAAAVALPTAAQAQDQATTDTDDIDTVIVTGSRIRRLDTETASPVLTISAEDISRTGLTTMGDVLQRLPTVAGAATNPAVNNGGGTGESNVELRGLGA